MDKIFSTVQMRHYCQENQTHSPSLMFCQSVQVRSRNPSLSDSECVTPAEGEGKETESEPPSSGEEIPCLSLAACGGRRAQDVTGCGKKVSPQVLPRLSFSVNDKTVTSFHS